MEPLPVILSSLAAVSKVYIAMGAGAYMSYRDFLTTPASQSMSKMLYHIGYPTLLFSNLVIALDGSVNSLIWVIIAMSVLFHAILGLLGLLLKRTLATPVTFRWCVVAVMMLGNVGDLVFAVVSTAGDVPPFEPGDEVRGLGYASIYVIVANVANFTFGEFLIRLDMQQQQQYAAVRSSDTFHLGTLSKTATEEHLALTHAAAAEHAQDDGGRIDGDGEQEDAGKEEEEEEDLTHVPRPRGPSGWSQLDDDAIDDASPPPSPSVSARRREPFPYLLRSVSRMGFESKNPAAQHAWRFLRGLVTPPNIAVVAGIIVGCVPALRGLFIAADADDSDTPPLKFVFDVLKMLGATGVPLGLMMVGAALEKIVNRKRHRPQGGGGAHAADAAPYDEDGVRAAVPTYMSAKQTAIVASTRVLVMPVIGLAIILALRAATFIPADDLMLQFVLFLDASVPTATSCLVLAQIHGSDGLDIARVMLVQYALCIVSIPLGITAVLFLLSADLPF